MPWQLLPPLSLLWFHHPPMYLQLHPPLPLNLGVWGVTATTYFNRKHYTATKSFTNANFNTSSLLYQLIHIWIIYRFAKSKVYLFNWFTWLDLDQGWNLSAQIIECTQIRNKQIFLLDTPHTFLARHTVNNLKTFLTVKSQQSQGVYSGGLSDLTGSMGNEVSWWRHLEIF